MPRLDRCQRPGCRDRAPLWSAAGAVAVVTASKELYRAARMPNALSAATRLARPATLASGATVRGKTSAATSAAPKMTQPVSKTNQDATGGCPLPRKTIVEVRVLRHEETLTQIPHGVYSRMEYQP